MMVNVTDLMRRFELAGYPLTYGGNIHEGNNFVTIRKKKGRRLGQPVFETQQLPAKTINYYYHDEDTNKTLQFWIIEVQKKADSEDWDSNFVDTNAQRSRVDMKYSNMVLIMEDPNAPTEDDFPSFQVFYMDIKNMMENRPFQGVPLNNFADSVLVEWVNLALTTPYTQMPHWKSGENPKARVRHDHKEDPDDMPPQTRRTPTQRR